MGLKRKVLFLFLLASFSESWSSTGGLTKAADYYYSRQDYRQSLQLWNEVVKKQPENYYALTRLAELKLMIEGKHSAHVFLLSLLRPKNKPLDGFTAGVLSRKLTDILSTFTSDESQSLCLQARPKLTFNDCEGALVLLRQALTLEPENLVILRDKAHCEKSLKQFDNYLETLRTIYALNPFDPLSVDEFLRGLYVAKKYPEVIALFSSDIGLLDTEVRRLIYASSLVEMQKDAEALVVVNSFNTNKEYGKERKVPALVPYLKGKIFSRSSKYKQEESMQLKLFLDLAKSDKLNSEFSIFSLEDKVLETNKRRAEIEG